MAFQSHRTRFKGDLAGIKQEEIMELDYTKENIDERMEYIKKKYSYMRKYHEEYTSEYYKVNVNTDDNLSSDINVFKAIERDANYLLNSLDIPRDSQYKYNLLTQEEFDKMLKKEEKGDITEEVYQNILVSKDKNDYINMDLVITKKDLNEDSEMGVILRDYEKIKTHIKEEHMKLKSGKGSYINLYSIKLILGTINCDMLDVKKSYKGITRPSNKLGDIGSLPDYGAIKYSNPAHVKALITYIRFGEIEPDSMLSHMVYDMEKAVKELYKAGMIDDLDVEIIDCINSGMSNVATAREIQRDESTVRARMDKVCKKIALFYSYLEIVELG